MSLAGTRSSRNALVDANGRRPRHHWRSTQFWFDKSVRKAVALIAKLTITVALLYFALSRINLDVVVQRLQHLNVAWLVAAVAVLGAQAVVAAERWRSILAQCDAAVSIRLAARYTFVSLFFGQVLPSTVGGDAARVWLVARDGVGWAKAAYSAINDRAIGLLSLALFVLLGIPASFAMIQDPLARATLVILGFASAIAPVLFIGMGARQWTPLSRFSVTRHLNAAACVGYRIMTSPRAGGRVLGLSLIIQILTITGAWLAAKSVAAPFKFVDAVLLFPPVLLITTIPISIAGWGLREGVMVMAFAYSSLPQADGLLISALFGVTTFALGIIGGAIWMIAGRRPRE